MQVTRLHITHKENVISSETNCAGNMIWRQVKQRKNHKSKTTYFFVYILNRRAHKKVS